MKKTTLFCAVVCLVPLLVPLGAWAQTCSGDGTTCPNGTSATCYEGVWTCEVCDGSDSLEDDEPLPDRCVFGRCYPPVYDLGQHELCNTEANEDGQCGRCARAIVGNEFTVIEGRRMVIPLFGAQCVYETCASRVGLEMRTSGRTLTVTVTGALRDYPYRLALNDPTSTPIPGRPTTRSRTVRTDAAGTAVAVFSLGGCHRPSGPTTSTAPLVTASITEAGVGQTRVLAATFVAIPRCSL